MNVSTTWHLAMIVMAAGLISPLSIGAEHPGTSAAAPAVEGTLADYDPATTIDGRMTIAGSDTMQPILIKIVQEFRRWHPEATIIVQGESMRLGARSLVDSLIDGIAGMRQGDGEDSGHMGSRHIKVLALSRELSPEELKKFRNRHGYEPIPIAVAQDAVAVYVNATNPIHGLTLGQLDAIFSKDRKRGGGAAKTWGELGLQGEWAAAAIRPYGRDATSTGTRSFFQHAALLDGPFAHNVKEEAGSASVILAITRDRFGIGYSGVGFTASAVRQVPLAVDAGAPFIAPSSETVTSKQYPLSRTLYLYVNKAADEQLTPLVKEFLRFVNTLPAQQAVARAGVYPLTSAQASDNLAKLGEAGAARAAAELAARN